MTTTRDTIADALIAHSYTDYDYGYHCICGRAAGTQAGMIRHIADKVLSASTLPAFTEFGIEWQVRDTLTGKVLPLDDGVVSRDEAEQMVRDWPEGDLELVCRETGATDWHTPSQAAGVPA